MREQREVVGSMTDLTLPDLPEFEIPKLPDFDLPDLPDFELPDLPGFNLSNLPDSELPDLTKTCRPVRLQNQLSRGSIIGNANEEV